MTQQRSRNVHPRDPAHDTTHLWHRQPPSYNPAKLCLPHPRPTNYTCSNCQVPAHASTASTWPDWPGELKSQQYCRHLRRRPKPPLHPDDQPRNGVSNQYEARMQPYGHQLPSPRRRLHQPSNMLTVQPWQPTPNPGVWFGSLLLNPPVLTAKMQRSSTRRWAQKKTLLAHRTKTKTCD